MPRRAAVGPPLVVLLAALAATGCARAVSIGSDPAPVYRVEVRNATATAVNVFYSFASGEGERVLGNVQAGGTEEFVIAGAEGGSVWILGRAASGQGTYGPYSVPLVAGEVRRVVIGGT